jgi:hypothetical protein
MSTCFRHREEFLHDRLGWFGKRLSLPLTAEGVTAAWLSAGLRTRYPGVVITQVEPVQIIDGIATKVRLRLAYGPRTRRDGLPDQMCVKGGFGAYREYLGGMGFYSGEVRFFNEIAPLYELARPASYFGLTQSDPVQGIVALEDLQARGVAFGRATRPLSVELARAGLDALAALHGQSWGDGRPRRLGVEPLLSDTTEPILRDFFAALPERFAAPRGFAAPVALHEPDRLRAGFAAYRAGHSGAVRCAWFTATPTSATPTSSPMGEWVSLIGRPSRSGPGCTT